LEVIIPSTINRVLYALGLAVDVAGDLLVAGANRDDTMGPGAGAVHVFDRSSGTWVPFPVVFADDTSGADLFGYKVAVNSGRIYASAPRENADGMIDSGAAYVFELVGGVWVQTAKLTPSDAEAGDFFGTSLAADGDTVVVGASRKHGDSVARQGAAYVFEFIGGVWTQTAKLTGDVIKGGRFGHSADIDGDVIIIGAPYQREGVGGKAGATYISNRVGGVWGAPAKFTPSDPARGQFFGYDVSVAGTSFLIGAPGDATAGFRTGAVYLAQETAGPGTATQMLKRTSPTSTDADLYGLAVSLSSTRAGVGSPGYDGAGTPDSGEVNFYDVDLGTPSMTHRTTAAGTAADAATGASVAVHETRAAFGTPLDSVHAATGGSATAVNLA
ncbi:MAG: hypothetical protein ACPGQL_03645, partial [Thermoplasmatota archaeon]